MKTVKNKLRLIYILWYRVGVENTIGMYVRQDRVEIYRNVR